MPEAVVIIGGGQGGFQAAASLRTEGFDGRITIVGDEPGLPYQRPPLSKAFLLGKQQAYHTELRPRTYFETHRIELIESQRAIALDLRARTVTLASGSRLEYDHLILATGARNRMLPVEGATLEGICYLRTLAEAHQMRERIGQAQSVAVIGGGFIGLEVAAVARALDRPVTVIEAAPRLMARVVAPPVSDFFQRMHAAQSVHVLLNASVTAITGASGKAAGVRLADGRMVPADLIAVGIGVIPNIELARDAGLPMGNGITVDEHLRTAGPRVFAIGDCSEFPSFFTGTRVRLESVQNAVDQAASVARTICGRPIPYADTPWFWTEQFDVRLQMAGLAPQFDELVLRGDPESRKFSLFYFHQGRLRAVDSINRPADHLAARKLIGARAPVTPQQAADESIELKKLL